MERSPAGWLPAPRDTAQAPQGRPSMSAQAVGGAVGHNPISIIIPCHRVVGSSGSLTGYAGGLEKKAALLALEGADLQHLLTDGAWNTGP